MTQTRTPVINNITCILAHVLRIFRVRVSRVGVTRVSDRVRVRLVIIAYQLIAHRVAIPIICCVCII